MAKRVRYKVITVTKDGARVRVPEHVFIWEEANGPIPFGWIIHHKNEIKTDNRIENLEAMSRSDHIRHHRGSTKINGEWWKNCSNCKKLLRTAVDFYKVKSCNGTTGRCKACSKKLTHKYTKASRAAIYGPPTPKGRPKAGMARGTGRSGPNRLKLKQLQSPGQQKKT